LANRSLALILLLLVRAACAAPAELRGTWLTTTGVDHIRTGGSTATVMADLKNIGLNATYVESWKNGYTNYPSPTLKNLTGGADRSTFLGTTRDLMKETTIHAHRQGLTHTAWFEYGFSPQFLSGTAAPSNPLAVYMRDQGWLLKDQAGAYSNSTNQFAWMNPAVPQVRQFLINVVLEAVNRYDLDGIQFDDRLAWPQTLGWDSTTAALYLADTGRALPTSINDTNFRNWRQDQVTEFAQELKAAVKAVRPELRISVSPSVTNFSDINYNAEWPVWVDQGIFDEYIPQIYRSGITSFNNTIPGQTSQFTPNDLDKYLVGIAINTSPINTAADTQAMITKSRTEGAAGHVLWYSAGVRDTYPTQLTSFYNVAGQGPAQNPYFPADWRPAPTVATAVPGVTNTWEATVATAGRYTVVAKMGTSATSLWQEMYSLLLDPSAATRVTIAGASQVELLVDRRTTGVLVGDFNDDGKVDTADYTVWRDTVGTNVFSATGADGDGNGAITNADLDTWRRNFGRSLASAAVVVAIPEPAAMPLLLLALLSRRFIKKSATNRTGQ
jgi:uncharacterized lipoprotein YddW (UPF0748 family)